MYKSFLFLLLALAMWSCHQNNLDYHVLDAQKFNWELNDKQINLYNLTNKTGMTVQITNYGARIVSIWTPDKVGNYADVSLGFATAEEYINANSSFYGAMVGRYANRIAKGSFAIEDDTIQLAINNGVNNIHGGPNGFYKQVWEVEQASNDILKLSYLSKDGDQGFPGNLNVKVTYELTDENALKITSEATTDKTTVINLCNHTFFNLLGEGSGTTMDHLLYVNADYYTPLDSVQIPTGEIAPVESTPYDFTKSTALSARIDEPFKQLLMGNGYDINFVLNKTEEEISHAATLTEPISGRVMEVYTTEPGMQLYTANFLNGLDVGKHGKPFKRRESVCLETQHFPNSPNQKNFPSTMLHPDSTFKSVTIYKFDVNK